jgi:hypothetical protein
VPPSVKLPELVTVPESVNPLTVPVPLTDVTEPLAVIGTFITFVIRPFASTINCGTVVPEPYVPVVAFTVASVVANDPVPDPDTSPVKAIVWSPVLVPLK